MTEPIKMTVEISGTQIKLLDITHIDLVSEATKEWFSDPPSYQASSLVVRKGFFTDDLLLSVTSKDIPTADKAELEAAWKVYQDHENSVRPPPNGSREDWDKQLAALKEAYEKVAGAHKAVLVAKATEKTKEIIQLWDAALAHAARQNC